MPLIRLESGLFALALSFGAPVLAETEAKPPGAGSVEELVITATRSEQPALTVPAAVTAQDFVELQREGFLYGTDEFRGVPGVYFRRGEGDGEEFPSVSIRGITGNHGNDTFLALLDGIPFVGADEEVLLFEVPYSAVERVEVVRGPASALYGRGAIAGAVNYRTKTPDENAWHLSASAGSHGYYAGDIVLERQFGEHAALVSLATESDGGWREHSSRRKSNLFAKGEFALRDATTLTLSLNAMDREAEVPGAIPAFPNGDVLRVGGGREAFLGFGDPHNDFWGVQGAARLRHELSDELALTISLHGRRIERDVFLNFYDTFASLPAANRMVVNGFGSDDVSTALFGEALLQWQHGRHSLAAGFSGERATLDEREFWTGQNGFTPACGFAFFAIEIDTLSGSVLNEGHPCFVRDEVLTDAESRNVFWGVFVQDEIALADQWFVTLGLRYESFERTADFAPVGLFNPGGKQSGDESAFAPKASLSWRYGEGQLYVSYGRGFNSNFGPVWQWDPSQYARDEQPTTLDSIELGWKARPFEGRLQVETAAFFLTQKNRRIFVTNPNPGPPTLATSGQRYESLGLELAAIAEPIAGSKLTLAYTWLDAEWKELVIDTFGGPVDLSGNEPTGVPRHLLHLEAEQQLGERVRVRAAYEWYADYRITQDNAFSGGKYDLLGVSASIELPWREGIGLDLSLTNLLGEKYFGFFGDRTQVNYATPGPPRLFRATLRASF